MDVTSNNLELHIEELVLHGFAPGDRDRIAEAVVHELTRLLGEPADRSWRRQGGAVAYLDGGTFVIAPGARAGAIGTQVARAVYRGLEP